MRKERSRLYAGVVALLRSLCSTPADGRTVETGFLNRVVSVDGVEFRHQVYVPVSFQRSTSWPVILALHGSDEYGDDGLKQTDGGIARAIRQHHERFPAIVVIPQRKADGTTGWQGAGGRAATAALERAVAEFNGDRSRLYLTGLSAGGNGAWYLGSRNPERFAALVVVSGWISERKGTTSGVAYPSLAPPGTADQFACVAARVSTVPIWIFHGDADRVVPVDESRQMAAALKNWVPTCSTPSSRALITMRGIRHMHVRTCGHGSCGNEGARHCHHLTWHAADGAEGSTSCSCQAPLVLTVPETRVMRHGSTSGTIQADRPTLRSPPYWDAGHR